MLILVAVLIPLSVLTLVVTVILVAIVILVAVLIPLTVLTLVVTVILVAIVILVGLLVLVFMLIPSHCRASNGTDLPISPCNRFSVLSFSPDILPGQWHTQAQSWVQIHRIHAYV